MTTLFSNTVFCALLMGASTAAMAAGLSEGQLPTENQFEAETGSAKKEHQAILSNLEIFSDCADCPAMVKIPAGSFRMGDLGGSGESDEKPVHSVTLSSFAVSQTEVTFAQYDQCVNAGECDQNGGDEGWGRGNRPVINVSWNDARSYADWLSKMTGKSYRLLTEAEWEYAARAGSTTEFSWGNDINCSLARYGQYKGDCGNERSTVPVGRYAPNQFGLYDMHGNVWEWVDDCYQDSYLGASANGSALNLDSCELRILRGGSWGSKPGRLRLALRVEVPPEGLFNARGFRIARDIGSIR